MPSDPDALSASSIPKTPLSGRAVAYFYSDPRLESPQPQVWGWEIDQVYCDWATGDSAASNLAASDLAASNLTGDALSSQEPTNVSERPQLAQLLQDCARGRVSYLLVRRLDELGESSAQVGQWLSQLEAAGVTVLATEQDYCSPPGAPDTTAQSAFLKLLDEIEFYQRSRRIRQGHARNRLHRLLPPGKAPFGYRRGKDRYVIDKAAAPLVRAFVERFLLFGSLRGAVRFLAKKYGKTISASTGQRWLTSPVYRGDLIYQGKDRVADTHAPIISREDGAQIDRLLRRNRRLPPRTASAPRSLAGLVTCATCQSAMTVSTVSARQQKTYLYLRPVACPRQPKCKAIAYQQVLDRAIAAICQDLPKAVAAVQQPELSAIKAGIAQQIRQKQAVIDRLPELIQEGILDEATADLRRYTLQTEIAAIGEQQAQLPPINLLEIAQTVSIPQFWQDLSEAERRFYFREFLQRIDIIRGEADWAIALKFIF